MNASMSRMRRLEEAVGESSISGLESMLRELCGRGDRRACNLSAKLWRHGLDVVSRAVEAAGPICGGEAECLRRASRLAVDYMGIRGRDLSEKCGEGSGAESATACVVLDALREFCRAYPTYCAMYASGREAGK